jgi:hypothetical protein
VRIQRSDRVREGRNPVVWINLKIYGMTLGVAALFLKHAIDYT